MGPLRSHTPSPPPPRQTGNGCGGDFLWEIPPKHHTFICTKRDILEMHSHPPDSGLPSGGQRGAATRGGWGTFQEPLQCPVASAGCPLPAPFITRCEVHKITNSRGRRGVTTEDSPSQAWTNNGSVFSHQKRVTSLKRES